MPRRLVIASDDDDDDDKVLASDDDDDQVTSPFINAHAILQINCRRRDALDCTQQRHSCAQPYAQDSNCQNHAVNIAMLTTQHHV